MNRTPSIGRKVTADRIGQSVMAYGVPPANMKTVISIATPISIAKA